MRINRSLLVLALLAAALAGASCRNGGDPDPGNPRIVSINLNPAAAQAGTVVELSASISAPGQSVSSLVKNWEVTAGSLTTTPPDLALAVRGTEKSVSELTASTTNNMVYWLTPASAGSATVTLTVGSATKSQAVNVTASPLTMSVSASGGKQVVTVRASNVTDLYQAAFRVYYSSAWVPESVEQGDFLGAAADTLFLGLTNQVGFVPVGITLKGNAAGVDGSGVLAVITFAPAPAAASVSAAPAASQPPFELTMPVLMTSSGRDQAQ